MSHQPEASPFAGGGAVKAKTPGRLDETHVSQASPINTYRNDGGMAVVFQGLSDSCTCPFQVVAMSIRSSGHARADPGRMGLRGPDPGPVYIILVPWLSRPALTASGVPS